MAACRWRLAEIAPSTGPGSRSRPRPYEIAAVWESGELANLTEEVAVPAGIAKSGHIYRARVRLKDDTGRWSHWSAPVEFVAGE